MSTHMDPGLAPSSERANGYSSRLSSGTMKLQWPAAAVRGEADLCGQSVAGTPEGMVGRLAGRGKLWQAPAAC